MSDTFFTASPHWTWWIILYFFVGGIAGTAFFLVSLLDWGSRQTAVARTAVASRQPPVVRFMSARRPDRQYSRLPLTVPLREPPYQD